MDDLIERLRADAASSKEGYQCVCYVRTITEAADRIATQQEAIGELVAGLAFYGDIEAWNQPPVKTVHHELLGPAYENQASKVRLDRGKIARALLSKHGERT